MQGPFANKRWLLLSVAGGTDARQAGFWDDALLCKKLLIPLFSGLREQRQSCCILRNGWLRAEREDMRCAFVFSLHLILGHPWCIGASADWATQCCEFCGGSGVGPTLVLNPSCARVEADYSVEDTGK